MFVRRLQSVTRTGPPASYSRRARFGGRPEASDKIRRRVNERYAEYRRWNGTGRADGGEIAVLIIYVQGRDSSTKTNVTAVLKVVCPLRRVPYSQRTDGFDVFQLYNRHGQLRNRNGGRVRKRVWVSDAVSCP